MGCDIHLHVEIKIKGRWFCYNSPDIGRDYGLFYKLASVRGPRLGVTPIDDPRGLPDDISAITALNAANMDGDGHSHSYITAEEIASLCKWAKESGRKGEPEWMDWQDSTFGYLFGNGMESWWEYPEDNKHLKELGMEDVRFVFWFDN